MRYPAVLALLAVLVAAVATCGVEGGGTPVPFPPADFPPGSTIPGFVVTQAEAGRADLQATAAHVAGRWRVVLSRPLDRRPRDLHFGLAVTDDGTAHSGSPVLRLTADPAAQPDGLTVVARPAPAGGILPDGVMAPGEWDPSSFSTITVTPQSDVPAGRYPPAQSFPVLAGAAYDDVYVYLIFAWQDPSGTRSDLGPLLQWDGGAWFRRPHAANDLDGNGLLGPGEPQTFTADAEDEDRLFLFFPIEDEAGSFVPGGTGCAASCHPEPWPSSGFQKPGHYGLPVRSLVDVWEWRAAATGPGRRAQDRVLRRDEGIADDGGGAPFLSQDPAAPQLMFQSPPAGFEPLVAETLDFSAGTAPGFPVPAPVLPNAAPYDPADFNGTGLPPAQWSGAPPFFGNDFLPPFAQVAPAGGAADLEAGSTFDTGLWTVELRRRRATTDAAGAPAADDVQFDEDADFRGEAFNAEGAGTGLSFSVSITDRAAGHGVRESRYAGPLFMRTAGGPPGAALTDVLHLHDYGPGFAPQDPADFTDPRVTTPQLTGGVAAGLELKAGTDGGATLFVSALWDDPVADGTGAEWRWDGFAWSLAGAEDELRILWNRSVPRDAFVAAGGCAYLCHGHLPGLPAPASLLFSTRAVNEGTDLWHWRAARSADPGRPDDAVADWRLFGTAPGVPPAAAVHGDGGGAPFFLNVDEAAGLPDFMSPQDPGANAPLLTLGVPGFPDAVDFVDVQAGLPPGGPTGGTVSYSQEVQPVFDANCIICHPPSAGLDLTSFSALMAGGQSGPVVVPGNPQDSILIQRLTGVLTPQMPLGGNPLPQATIDRIAQWIQEGALDT